MVVAAVLTRVDTIRPGREGPADAHSLAERSLPLVKQLQHRRELFDCRFRVRVEDDLNVGDAGRGVRPKGLANSSVVPAIGGLPMSVGSPMIRPWAPLMATKTAQVFSSVAGSRPTSTQAASILASSGGRFSTRLPNQAYQAFHDWTWGRAIRSIRGPSEPIISGGPSGLGPLGRSRQSAAS
jgi:hypothetical protein